MTRLSKAALIAADNSIRATKVDPAPAVAPKSRTKTTVREEHPAEAAPKSQGKLASLAGLLQRPGGATLEAMMQATGWQAHSVRGAISGALKKTRGLAIISEKTVAGRVYRIAAERDA